MQPLLLSLMYLAWCLDPLCVTGAGSDWLLLPPGGQALVPLHVLCLATFEVSLLQNAMFSHCNKQQDTYPRKSDILPNLGRCWNTVHKGPER